jgi:hypothetical protein
LSFLLTVVRAARCGLDGGLEATGRPACTLHGPQRERRTAAAELLVSRGMTARRSGEEGRWSRCGHEVRPGASPAMQRGRLGGSGVVVPERTTRISGTRGGSLPSLMRAASKSAPRRRCRRADDDGAPFRGAVHQRVRDEAGELGDRRESANRLSRRPDPTRSRYGVASATREAINASGALNRPRRNSGGTTASTASSFSLGSMRR